MNANELDERLVETAKFIDSVSSNWQAVRTIESARTMLRQQQEQIKALKEANEELAKYKWMYEGLCK